MAEVGLQRTLAAIENLDADESLPAPAARFSRAGRALQPRRRLRRLLARGVRAAQESAATMVIAML